MKEKYTIGSYGRAKFWYTKKGYRVGIDAVGTVKEMDGNYIMFVDNEDYHYLVRKDRFKFNTTEL